MPLKEIKYEAALRFSEDADDNQQIAGQADDRCYDNPSNREDIGFEGFFCAPVARHQDVARCNQTTGYDDDVSAVHQDADGAINAVGYSAHIDGCIG